jgi:subtilisin family serine protease
MRLLGALLPCCFDTSEFVMLHRSRLLSWFLTSHLWLLFLLVLITLAWGDAEDANATGDTPPLSSELSSAPSAVATDIERPFAGYMIQLDEPPVLEFYTALASSNQAQSASVAALTQAHLATVEQAQETVMAALTEHEAQLLYRVQRVFNGVAVFTPVDQVAALAKLPGVQAVYPLVSKTPSNTRAAKLLQAPALWEGIDRAGLTGQGVTIAIIDTGIDYLHTMFGGPGGGYALNNTSVITDTPYFPSTKIIGGYDFAGDGYDASLTSASYQPVPQPDPDPMDCYGFGHGTHVAGTAAGYGVNVDGTTYAGPYDTTTNLDNLRIGPGIAPQASIYALKVFGCSGSSDVVDAAIEWAVDPNQDGDFSDHVDVINLSLGSSFGASFDPTVVAVQNAASLGIVVVSSAGNAGDVHYAIGSPGMAPYALGVAATSIDTKDPANFADGLIASFSARGPRRADGGLKPDLTAPGVSIISARRGTGNQAVSSSGTSMASPVAAGVMALLREAYPADGLPNWRIEELKALVMNTATYPLLQPDMGVPYSLLRAGAGRINPTAALQSSLIAYDAAAPEQVSVSFGTVEVLDKTTAIREIRLANKGSAPISVTVGYTAVRELPGVTIDVGVGNVIAIAAGGVATLPVTLTADAAAMTRQPDITRQVIPPNASPWLDEVSGYAIFTPIHAMSGTQSSAIHLPIHALPRKVSALSLTGEPLVLGEEATTSFALTVTGTAISTLPAPTATVPLMGLFSLAHSSPPIIETPDEDDPRLEHFALADLRYVGTAGPVLVDGEPTLYFVLVTYGSWSSPLEVVFEIQLDIDGDQTIEYQLTNREATDVSSFDVATTDEFVSLLESSSSIRTVQGPLNVFPADQYDTRVFDTNVMVLPLRLSELGTGMSQIRYRVATFSRDVSSTPQFGESVDETPFLTLNIAPPATTEITSLRILFPAASGDLLVANVNRAVYLQQQSQGVLAVFLHNNILTRTQVLPVEITWPIHQYLPSIFD